MILSFPQNRNLSIASFFYGLSAAWHMRRKGHAVAVGAVARYLAESTYWVLKKAEPYREPPHWASSGKRSPVSLSQEQARAQHGS